MKFNLNESWWHFNHTSGKKLCQLQFFPLWDIPLAEIVKFWENIRNFYWQMGTIFHEIFVKICMGLDCPHGVFFSNYGQPLNFIMVNGKLFDRPWNYVQVLIHCKCGCNQAWIAIFTAWCYALYPMAVCLLVRPSVASWSSTKMAKCKIILTVPHNSHRL